MDVDTKPSETVAAVDSPAPANSPPRTLNDMESRYMQGDREPVTSSVLISSSKYLNNPYYRDAFMQQALRRVGHDLPPTYMVPLMIKAISETGDMAETMRALALEKAKNAEFAAWLDARQLTRYRAEDLQGYAEGTLGAEIRAFLQIPGMEMEFVDKGAEPRNDLEYLLKRRGLSHDIEHMVTGFGPNTAGEQALALANISVNSRYFSPTLAHFLSHGNIFVSAGGYMRTATHYHNVLPTYLDAMQKGIAAGLVLKKPLFMTVWEDYLDWQLEDIAADLGIARGPGDEWTWTTEAAMG
jgi:ubiquinone biosynthesis protein COQ4